MILSIREVIVNLINFLNYYVRRHRTRNKFLFQRRKIKTNPLRKYKEQTTFKTILQEKRKIKQLVKVDTLKLEISYNIDVDTFTS